MDKLALASKLMDQGFSLLAGELYGAALKTGQRLRKLRHSSAFEILALGYKGKGELSKAIAVLEKGTGKADRVWVLWKLLGDCYSDAGRFDEAETAYQKALRRERCDAPLIHLNRAIALVRSGKVVEAASAIRLAKSPSLLRRAEACRIRISLLLGETSTAKRFALRLSGRRPRADQCYDRYTEPEIYLTCALALKESPPTRSKALGLALRAVEYEPENGEALAVVREINNRRADGAKLYVLLIRGIWNAPIGTDNAPPGFFRSCRVVAPGEQAALKYATRFFPAAVRKSLKIEESRRRNAEDALLDGVYFLSAYHFYSRRKR
jgi:tetratricopeptide (TPR) repeat protein